MNSIERLYYNTRGIEGSTISEIAKRQKCIGYKSPQSKIRELLAYDSRNTNSIRELLYSRRNRAGINPYFLEHGLTRLAIGGPCNIHSLYDPDEDESSIYTIEDYVHNYF